MRQADVIGVWEKLGQAKAVEPGALVERRCIWRAGLRFEDFAASQLDLVVWFAPLISLWAL
jgi:hypothetical protein